MAYVRYDKTPMMISTVSQWNERVTNPSQILTGKEFRRKKRAGELNLICNG